jgi:hypothetical protein
MIAASCRIQRGLQPADSAVLCGHGKQRRTKTRKEEAETEETEDYPVIFGFYLFIWCAKLSGFFHSLGTA